MTNSEAEVEGRAKALHYSSLVIDALAPRVNCDLMLTPGMTENAIGLLRSGKSRRKARVDLAHLLVREMRDEPNVREEYKSLWDDAGVDIANTTQLGAVSPHEAFEESFEMMQATHALVDVLSPTFRLITSESDIDRVIAHDGKGIIMNLQNASAFEGNLNRVEQFYNLGVRVVQLTYNRRNRLGDGCTEDNDGGLTYYGREVLRLLNELNIMVDLSHCGPQTTWDAIERSSEPVVFTHTSADSLCSHDRAKSDAQIKAVAEIGGFVGVLCVPAFIMESPQGDLTDFADHLEHIIGIAGIENVGIGTDYGRCYDLPAEYERAARSVQSDLPCARTFDWVGWRPEHRIADEHHVSGFSQWTDWPNLTTMLVNMGLSDPEIRGLLGENFRRVFSNICG